MMNFYRCAEEPGDLTHDLRDILIWVPHSNPYPARVPLPTDAQKSLNGYKK